MTELNHTTAKIKGEDDKGEEQMPKLYTAKIYDSLRIHKAMPDAVQICIQRRPWRYIRKAAEVIKFPALGPPADLHKETREFLARLEIIGATESEVVDFQTRYAARYLSHILVGSDRMSEKDELMEIRRYLFGLKRDVILECSCDARAFCHRLLLYHLLISWYGEEYAGGELELKETEKK